MHLKLVAVAVSESVAAVVVVAEVGAGAGAGVWSHVYAFVSLCHSIHGCKHFGYW